MAGAAHLLNENADVLRGAHGEQKSPVEQKGKDKANDDNIYDDDAVYTDDCIMAEAITWD